MRLPWISRDHHREVVEAKDALIAALEAQNVLLAKRLESPISVSAILPDNFAVLQPAILRKKKDTAASAMEHREPRSIDWANVDVNNPFIMAELAAQEFGRMLSPIELMDWTQRVQRQVHTAKLQSASNPQIPTAGTLEKKAVPPEILAKIEEAERA